MNTAAHPLAPGDRGFDGLLKQLEGLTSPAAAFLNALHKDKLKQYHKVVSEPRPDLDSGPAPHLLNASVDQVGEWLHTVWRQTEDDSRDPSSEVIFENWLHSGAEDSFYRHHIHARFYLARINLEHRRFC
jgi:hypothetical protein